MTLRKVLAAAVLFTACADVNRVRVPTGELATPGVTITSLDGSFSVAAGQTFQTPQRCIGHDLDEYNDALRTDRGNVMSHSYHWMPVADGYARSLKYGALRVRVVVPGEPQPLYGVLAFYCVYDQATEPAAKSYMLQVPQSYVDATSGGRVSVVYETYYGGQVPTWALWLSRSPFP